MRYSYSNFVYSNVENMYELFKISKRQERHGDRFNLTVFPLKFECVYIILFIESTKLKLT